jgi:hypothetical protein
MGGACPAPKSGTLGYVAQSKGLQSGSLRRIGSVSGIKSMLARLKGADRDGTK